MEGDNWRTWFSLSNMRDTIFLVDSDSKEMRLILQSIAPHPPAALTWQAPSINYGIIDLNNFPNIVKKTDGRRLTEIELRLYGRPSTLDFVLRYLTLRMPDTKIIWREPNAEQALKPEDFKGISSGETFPLDALPQTARAKIRSLDQRKLHRFDAKESFPAEPSLPASAAPPAKRGRIERDAESPEASAVGAAADDAYARGYAEGLRFIRNIARSF